MKNSARQSADWSDTILHWVTTIASTQTQPRRVIALQLILAWIIVLALIYALGYQIILQEAPIVPLWRLVIVIALYGISRTAYHVIASVGIVIWVIIQPFLFLIAPAAHVELGILAIVSLSAIPLAVILFDKRSLLIVCAAVVTSLLLLLLITNTLDPMLVLILVIGTLAMMMMFAIYREMFVPLSRLGHPNLSGQLIDVSPDLMTIIVDGKITYINRAGLQILGVKDEEQILGRMLPDVIAQSETASSSQHITRSNAIGDLTFQSIETFKRPDDSTVRVLVTVAPFDNDGEVATLLTAKPMPQSINQAEQILESISAISSIEQDGKVVYLNSEFERITGYSREEIYTSTEVAYQILHPDDREHFKDWSEAMFAGTAKSKSIEFRFVHKDGSSIWVRSSGSMIRYDGKPALLKTTVDISNHRPSTTAIPQAIQEAMPLPWLIADNKDDMTIIRAYYGGSVDWFADDKQLLDKRLSDILSDVPTNIETILEPSTQYTHPYAQRSTLKTGNAQQLPVEWITTRLQADSPHDYLITLRPAEYEAQLETDVDRYRTMFDMMNDYAFILKVLPQDEVEFVWVSNAFETVTGFDPAVDPTEEIIARTRYAEDQPIVDYHWQHLSRGEMSISEHRIKTKAGQIRWVREYAYPITEDGQISMIYGAVNDITDHIYTQEALKNHALQQALIAEIGMVAVRDDLGVDEFAYQILNLAIQLMTVPWCVLIEYRQSHNDFILHTMIGDAAEGGVESEPDNINSYLGYVLSHNDPVVVHDWATETRFAQPQAFTQLGIQSSLSVVVPMQDKPFGILNIHNSSLRQFSGDDVNLLQMVANIIGAYIQQRRTQVAEHEHRVMAEALSNIAATLNSTTELDDILRDILSFVSQIIPMVDSSNIVLVDPDRQVATLSIRHAVNQDISHTPSGQSFPLADIPIFSQMIETGNPIVLSDISQVDDWYSFPEMKWVQSYLAAPIFAGDECIGIINLDSTQKDTFKSEHVELLQAFLNQASIAIQNARHAEELVKEVERQTEKLQSEQAQLQAILHATGEGIFYSEESTILFTNETLANMMGYTTAELLGKSSYIFRPTDLTEEELQVRHNIQKALRSDGLLRVEIRFMRKDGSMFMGGVTASQVKIEDGKVRAVTVVRDISKEKEIEAQKESFISHAAHELRNPVTTLNTRIYLMKKKESVTEEDIGKMDEVVQKMNSLVAGLLDWSRFESGRIQLTLQSLILQTALGEVIDQQKPHADVKDITLSCEAPENPITIIADSLRLNQVFTNLIFNAINYTQVGGQIDVVIRYADVSQNTVMIEVIDNGMGIDEHSIKSLFQPFFQAWNNESYGGTGLGLSISKQIVEAHGGRIEVESVQGEGSRFIVSLPATADSDDN